MRSAISSPKGSMESRTNGANAAHSSGEGRSYHRCSNEAMSGQRAAPMTAAPSGPRGAWVSWRKASSRRASRTTQ